MLFEVDGGHLENQNGTIIRRRNVEECETTIRRQGWAHPELHDQEHHHHMRGGIHSSPLIFIIFQIITSLLVMFIQIYYTFWESSPKSVVLP